LRLLHFLHLLLMHQLEHLLHHLRIHAAKPIHRVVWDDLTATLGIHPQRLGAVLSDRVLLTWIYGTTKLPRRRSGATTKQ
jgi:hypothetical protein